MPAGASLHGDDVPTSGNGYQLRLKVFEGPFELLLQLLARRKLDVSEVDLAEVTGQFLARLPLDRRGGALDLDTATHFLLMVATLVELKAVRLLPTDDDFDDVIADVWADARDLFYARLLEFRAFRQAAGVLHGLLEMSAACVPRQAALEPRFQDLAPEVELSTGPTQLAALAASLLAQRRASRVDVGHIQPPSLSVREAAGRLLARLEPGEHATFHSLVAGLSAAERVAHFLALLELYKLGFVELGQPVPFGPLRVVRHAGCSDLTVLDSIRRSDSPGAAEPLPATGDPLITA